MIKCDLGHVSLKGSVPLIQEELEAVIVSIREAFIQKFGEENADELINNVIENSKKSKQKRYEEFNDSEKELFELFEVFKNMINEVIKDE